MKKVQDMLKLKPNIERINLSLLQIETINDLIFELFHFQNLREIDLSCNRLKALPKDLSILSNIERLDLSNNLFLDIESVLFSLSTMPNLKELNITYDPSQLKHTLNFYLPKVQVVNGEVLKSGGEPKMNNPITQVKNGKIDIIRAKSSKKLLNHGYLFYDEELSLLRTFQTFVQKYNDGLSPQQKSVKYEEHFKRMNDTIKSTYDYNNQIMDKCYEGIYAKNIDTLKPKLEHLNKLSSSYIKVVGTEYPVIANGVKNLLQMYNILIENMEKQASHLDEPIFKTKVLQQSRNSLISSPLLNIQDNKEQQENGKMVNFSNGERTLLKLKINELEKEIEELREENESVFKQLVEKAQTQVSEFREKVAKTPKGNIAFNLKNLVKREIVQIAVKEYTKKQILEIIQDVMVEKRIYDEKTRTKKNPPETLENFLYIYFSKKYGLKDMIKIQVSSIVDKISVYSKENVEIETFRRILKNEVDEKFYWFLQDLKGSIETKFQQYFKNSKKNASLVDSKNFSNEKKSKGINETEGKFIIQISYSGREQKKFLDKFSIFHQQNAVLDGDLKIPYEAFLNFVFNLELEKHMSYLKIISDFFNSLDQDHNGVITRKQFLQLLDVFVQRNVQCELDNILNEVDPLNFNLITFSKVTEVLSSKYADEQKTKNLIEFINSVQFQSLNQSKFFFLFF